MKLSRQLLVGSVILLATFALARATEEKEAEKVPVAPTLEDYENVLSRYKKSVKDSTDIEAWQGKELVNTHTKEKLVYDKLSNFEKHMFCVARGWKVLKTLATVNETWQNELQKFNDPKYEPKAKDNIDNPKQEPATKENIEEYLERLAELRNEAGLKYEKFVEKVTKDFKDEIPEKERKLYLQQIREFNEEMKKKKIEEGSH